MGKFVVKQAKNGQYFFNLKAANGEVIGVSEMYPTQKVCEAGIDAALAEVRQGPRREVPNYLRDRHRPGSDEYGPYLYPHNYPEGWVDQRYLPEGLDRGCFYHPSPRGWEAWRLDVAARDRS